MQIRNTLPDPGPRLLDRIEGEPILTYFRRRDKKIDPDLFSFVDQWNANGYEHPQARQAAALRVTIGQLGRMLSRGSKRLRGNQSGRQVERYQLVPDGKKKTANGSQKYRRIVHFKTAGA